MTYYYKSKEAALDAAVPYEGYWFTRAELEPNNGWVIVLSPRTKDVFKWPLADLLATVEVDLSNHARLRRRPPEYRSIALPVETAKKARPAKAAAPAKAKPPVMELTGEQRIAPSWLKAPQPPQEARPAPPPAPKAPAPAPAPTAPSGPENAPIKPAWLR